MLWSPEAGIGIWWMEKWTDFLVIGGFDGGFGFAGFGFEWFRFEQGGLQIGGYLGLRRWGMCDRREN